MSAVFYDLKIEADRIVARIDSLDTRSDVYLEPHSMMDDYLPDRLNAAEEAFGLKLIQEALDRKWARSAKSTQQKAWKGA